MGKELLWKPDVAGWQLVSVESYQFIIEQAKERLEEVISESHTIISRSLTLLLAYLTVYSGILGFIFSERNRQGFDLLTIIGISFLTIFSVYIFTLLFALIATRRIEYKGSPPKEIFRQEIFQEELPELWFKTLLYNEARRIQDKIERVHTLNTKRMRQFRSVLQASLLFVAIFVLAFLSRVLSVSWG